MVRTIRPAGIVAGVAIYLLLMVSGCQKDRATPPATKVEPPVRPAVVAEPPADAPLESTPQETTSETPQVKEAPPDPNEAQAPVDLTLKFSPGQTATYRATTEVEKRVEWMGPESRRPAGYADGRSGNHIEITFEQRVKEVRPNGNAVLEITIRALKYSGQIQSQPVSEFDSSKTQDQDNGLASLIGISYGVEMTARGKVIAPLDMESVRRAVKAGTPAHGVASKLFSDGVVKNRHEVPPLFALEDGLARPGQSWSDVKSFSFGDMGIKGYERIYTLTQVRRDEVRLALVKMKAIPSAAMAEEMHKRHRTEPPPGLFDNTEDYEGRLDFDLDKGQIREYGEEMWTEWVVVDPAAAEGVAPPTALKMGARQFHRLEQVPSS